MFLSFCERLDTVLFLKEAHKGRRQIADHISLAEMIAIGGF